MAAGSGEHDNESPIRIGSIVYCTTCFDDKIQGEVLCFEETTRLMAIKSTNGSRKGMCDVTLVNLNFTKTLEILEPPQHAKKNVKDLQPLNLEKVKRKEEENIRERKLRLEKGISDEGIKLYQTLTKTFKCTFHDKSMVVEGVTIDPPYRLENCKSQNSANLKGLDYIKKLVTKHYADQQNGA